MKLRHNIMLSFGSFTVVILSIVVFVNLYIVQRRLFAEAHEELIRVMDSVETAADAMIDTVIRNYLRGIVEQDVIVLENLNAEVERGHLTMQEARDAFQAHVDHQRIGASGYVAGVEPVGDQFKLSIHPFYRDLPCPDMEVCRDWMEQKYGYQSYLWMNPQDNEPRRKVSYLHYFEPWNWVIGATSYEDEFYQLVEIEDFKDLVSSFVIKNNGYIFILDSEYTMLVHPELEGQYVGDLQNAQGVNVTLEIMEHPGEFYYYNWNNPATGKEELKYSYMEKLEAFDWFVVATGYIGDIDRPIRRLMLYSYCFIAVSAIFLFLLILFFSRRLTNPLDEIIKGLNSFYQENMPFEVKFSTVSEIQSVGKAVESMTKAVLQSEKEKRNLLEQLDSIINSMPSILVGINAEQKIIFSNKKVEEYTGLSKDVILQRNFFDVFPGFAEASKEIHEGIDSSALRTINLTIAKDQLEAERGYYEMTIFPLTSHQKALVIRIDDVSRRVEMEEMISHSRKMDAIGQLAGGVAHDFNNMLAGILNSLEILDESIAPNEEDRIYLNIIEEAALRARDLTQQLLSFSRKDLTMPSPLDVHTAITQTAEILRRSIDKNIEIATELGAANTVIIGDKAQLQSLLLNLGVNASHAMPEGGDLSFKTSDLMLIQSIRLSQKEEMLPGEYIQIDVEDTGIGIPSELKSKIFEPFFTTKEQGEGTGLGLASVSAVVKQHKGYIELWSRENSGTRFSIYLPVSHIKEIDKNPEEVFHSDGTATVLVVEDEEILRTVTRGMLNDLGYNSISAENGRAALNLFYEQRKQIDLIIMDMIMPEMSGKDCLVEIRKIDQVIPVIIVSGFSKGHDIKLVQDQGVSSILKKPYTKATLSRAIKDALLDSKAGT